MQASTLEFPHNLLFDAILFKKVSLFLKTMSHNIKKDLAKQKKVINFASEMKRQHCFFIERNYTRHSGI